MAIEPVATWFPMGPDRVYRHFCMTARGLEVIGERWTLLIVRDLLLGPRRFSDLERGLSDITPTRLTDRLRLLESAGVVARDPSRGGGEVWYELTEAGRGLESVIDAVTLWGLQHRLEPPVPTEPVHPEPAMTGTKVWLNSRAPRLPDDLVWVWRFPGDNDFRLHLKDGTWRLAGGGDPAAAVTVLTTPEAWATFLTTPRDRRRLPGREIVLEGSQAEVRRFAKGFRARLVS
jgi:DNA-binding HxlR family transcriptional regulator